MSDVQRPDPSDAQQWRRDAAADGLAAAALDAPSLLAAANRRADDDRAEVQPGAAVAPPPTRSSTSTTTTGNAAAAVVATSTVVDLGFFHGFIASLSVILVSELGDKTFFIAAIMAMRHPRLVVFIGAIGALGLMTVLSGE